MNCQKFNDSLHEYLDGTLPRELQACAEEHIRLCGECRRALLQEQAFARTINNSLKIAARNLSIRPETLGNVLGVWQSERVSPNCLIRAWQRFISNPLRPIGAGAALVGALVLFVGIKAIHQTPGNSTSSTISKVHQNTWTIDVPIQTQTHVFLHHDGMVIDAISPSVAVGHARFLQLTK